MPENADGSYRYDEGTLNEQFDNVRIDEDDDGNISMLVGSSEVRIQELGYVFGAGGRAAPGTDELADTESMLYVDDSNQLVLAYNNDGSIVENVVDADITSA